MIGGSLSSRLTALLQGMAAVVIVAFAVSSLWLSSRTIHREEQALLKAAARQLAFDFDQELEEEGDAKRAAAAVLGERAASGFRIDIIGATGEVIGSSAAGAPEPDLHRAAAHSAGGATVVVSASHRPQSSAIAALARALIIAAVPIFLLTLLLSRFLIGRALRPLQQMERRAREASVEDAVRSIGPTFGLAEIDALRASFDHLLGRLDDLLQSERRFTSDASHELKTPLTILSGELEMALSRDGLPVSLREGLARASEQAVTMRELVEALLLLRRTERGADSTSDAFEPLNLTDLAGESVRAALHRNPERESDIRISGPDEVLVRGHAILLASALRNLVDNAVKFTAKGESIRIVVETVGEEASITIDDAGRGIPPDERDRIFDPFYRGAEARATGQGTGLGLPILRQVARSHGGEVTVGDSPLGGARFTLRLPLLRSR